MKDREDKSMGMPKLNINPHYGDFGANPKGPKPL
jgi:hypothetical protein